MTRRSELIAQLVRSEPTSPALTYYSGDGSGERVELSRRVVATWVAKAAGLLQDELEVGVEDAVLLDLPPHWRLAYWAAAVWTVGATVVLPSAPDAGPIDAEVLTTTRSQHPGARHVLVTLPALARRAAEPPPLDWVDEARELAGFPDDFTPFESPEGDRVAVVGAGAPILHGSQIETPWPAGSRVYTGTSDPAVFLNVMAQAWAGNGSLVYAPDSPDLESILASERVTQRAT